MRVFVLAFLCSVALNAVVAESENEVRRGGYPFMAFVYYEDATILDGGLRFTRSAALIKNDWLITSGDVSVAFPDKTLLARLGALKIDSQLTLNEDENEQEREVLLILRPFNYSSTEWWKTDVSLLKTLAPFTVSPYVSPAKLIKDVFELKSCYMLVYARRANATERTLMQINVELLPPLKEHCGNYYQNGTIICAASDKSNALAEPHFCKGNSGGPLVCSNELIGTQTYVTDCKQPFLYQFIPGWSKFISCAADDQYLTQSCTDVSITINKDPPVSPIPDIPRMSDIIEDMLDGKFYTSTIFTQSVYTQFNTDATESTTASKVEDLAATHEIETEVLSTKLKEELKEVEVIVTKTSIASEITSFSHDTTLTSTDTKYAEEDAAMETTVERERNNRIEAKQQLVRGEASLIKPSLFHYLMTSIYVLAYT